MKHSLRYYFFLLILLITNSCTNQNRFEFDYKNELVDVEIHRLDLAMIELDTVNLITSIKAIYQEYPNCFNLYINNFETVDFQDTLSISNSINHFINHPIVKDINEAVLHTFSEIGSIEEEISIAYTYLKHYFPGIQLPEIFFFTSGLSNSFLYSDDLRLIGLGSDFYLGSDFAHYQDYMYEYLIPHLTPENLSVDLLFTILLSNFPFDSNQKRLIDEMIYRGKIRYLLSVIMPSRADSEVLSFTKNQDLWANQYEKESWQAMVINKHLFSKESLVISKYLENAPFTAPISQDSPGRMGEWIGFHIVKKYMDKNRDVSLAELMMQNNYQYILEHSNYNP